MNNNQLRIGCKVKVELSNQKSICSKIEWIDDKGLLLTDIDQDCFFVFFHWSKIDSVKILELADF